jgi:hypothetical protein
MRVPAAGGPRWWAVVYLAIALPCMLFMALCMPMNEAPDEWSGIVRADSLRRGQFLGERVPGTDALGRPAPQAGIKADWALLRAAFLFAPDLPVSARVMTPDLLERQRAISWDGRTTLMMVANTAPYFPLLYAPGAVGLAMGQTMGLGPYDSMRLGRALMAFACALLGGAALWVAPRAHAVLLVSLSLPMTLSLGASFNMDGVLLAVSAFAAGCVLRGQVGAPPWRWVAALALAVVVAAKPPYAPLAMVFLCPASTDRTRSAWSLVIQRACLISIAILPGIAWLAIATARVATDFVVEPYLPGPLWDGAGDSLFTTIDRHAQIGILWRSPRLALSLPWNDLRREGAELLRQMIGVLAQLNLALPDWVYSAWRAVLPIALLSACLHRSKTSRPAATPLGAAAALFAVWATITAIILSQYVSWTRVGAASVDGVQGRYFLPVLAFLPFILPSIAARGAALIALDRAAKVLVALGVASSFVVLPRLVLASYYR